MKLKVENYALATKNNGLPLVCPIKRYTRSAVPHAGACEGRVILILGHGAGFSKEHWEPVLEDLFDNDTGESGDIVVREAWSLDAPNHGEGAIINEDILSRHPSTADIWDYADAYVTLVKSGLLGTLNPSYHQIVLCAHSAGSVAAVLSTGLFTPPSTLPFSDIILVDPAMWSRLMGDNAFASDMYKAVQGSTPLRRDMWDSKQSAAAWMKKRLPWSRWDDRAFNVFIEHNLRPLPTAHYPDIKTGVTLTTHKSEENMAFTGQIFSLDATDRLNQVCRYRPVHLIYGGLCDMFTKDVQDSLVSEQEGRTFASITRLSAKVGHLVVQEAPAELARAMFSILSKGRDFKVVPKL
ncbi:alpha/beta-hydrolase [Panaeolus papilionaceus]|nr:alpha/beta-hydrolase [Panaeolus papilionaceus]